jgi:general secretion pathway protein K
MQFDSSIIGKRQRGVALLTALVVLAIAATLAAAMHWNISLDQRRTAVLVQGDQALQYALGAESWADQILYRDAHPQSGAKHTSLDQDWAAQLPPLPVQGGQIIGHLEDLQGRFNINNLTGSTAQQAYTQFQQLLTALSLDPGIADAVADWVSPGNIPRPLGAKDDFYSRLQPPYRTADQPITSISELQMVKGITPDVYAKLQPYIAALPPGTPVNLNTASAPVIQSLSSPNKIIDAGTAMDIVNQRGTGPIPSPPPAALTGLQNTASDSSYFLLTAGVDIGTTRVTMYSLLYRDSGGFTHAIQRSLGTY